MGKIAKFLFTCGLSVLILLLVVFTRSSRGISNLRDNFLATIPRAYIVTSGSMEPVIKVGSLVFTAPIESYYNGNIVTFRDGKKYVTHRIEARLHPEGNYDAPIFLTSGDANDTFDTKKLSHDQIVGRVFLSIPYVGYVADFAKTPRGFILFVIIPATIIAYEELKFLLEKTKSEISRRKKPKLQGSDGNRFTKAVVFIPMFGAAMVLTGLTGSYYKDTEVSKDNSMQAGVFDSPTPSVVQTVTLTPTPIPPANHVVISEVQITGGTSHTTDDFIELYNPTDSSINLGIDDYRLVKRSGSSVTDTSIVEFTAVHVIPAHGYFLWANSGYTTIGVAPDSASTDTLASSNSVAIRQGVANTIIDGLSWNNALQSFKEGTEFTPDPIANQSMERKAYSTSTQTTMESGADSLKGNGFDSGDNAIDFILRLVAQPQNSSSPTEMP